MKGRGSIPVRIGNLVNAKLHGGRYLDRPSDTFGVKMAAEIVRPCNVDVPTKDFDVPNVQTLKRGVLKGLMAMSLGEEVYVGCMGGVGRTGLYLAAVAKVMSEYRKSKHRPGFDPVLYIRKEYYSHAVETQQQMDFIDKLDVSDIVEWCSLTQAALEGQLPPTLKDSIVDPAHEQLDTVFNPVAEPLLGQTNEEDMDYPTPPQTTVKATEFENGRVRYEIVASEEVMSDSPIRVPASEPIDQALERIDQLELKVEALEARLSRPWWRFWK